MPVSIETLQSESQSLEDEILDLLEKDRGHGYTETEIIRRLNGLSEVGAALFLIALDSQFNLAGPDPYREALANLESRGSVRRFRYRGQNHFVAAQ